MSLVLLQEPVFEQIMVPLLCIPTVVLSRAQQSLQTPDTLLDILGCIASVTKQEAFPCKWLDAET